ncbi:MAG: molybdopterin-guanine dinucleotide biosynthesis protein A [Kiritimatiellia bacterium]|jgi:molybdopterin-guanine dinucleotide biosynthesis protein A
MSERPPLYGLLLAGGKSSRMGRDKALISYRAGETQLEYGVRLLSEVVSCVFISQRANQAFPVPEGCGTVLDSMEELQGPGCGILSAMAQHPEADWLVIACDLPNLETVTLSKLIAAYHAQSERGPVAYQSTHDRLPEPLCAIYPKEMAPTLIALTRETGRMCPRFWLIRQEAALIEQDDPSALDNANTPDECEAMRKS